MERLRDAKSAVADWEREDHPNDEANPFLTAPSGRPRIDITPSTSAAVAAILEVSNHANHFLSSLRSTRRRRADYSAGESRKRSNFTPAAHRGDGAERSVARLVPG